MPRFSRQPNKLRLALKQRNCRQSWYSTTATT